MAVLGNQGSEPNYEPSSYSGAARADPAAHPKRYYVEDWVLTTAPPTYLCRYRLSRY
jgi:hypothetical protein